MRINVRFHEEDALRMNFGEAQTLTSSDYRELAHKPSINSVVLEGALSAEDLGLAQAYYDTKEHWDEQTTLIAQQSVIYIYSNYEYVEDLAGNRYPVAGLKIGDGLSYLIDLPFVGDKTTEIIINHLANTDVHISSAEREFWNNKVSCFIDRDNPENLVFSKTDYIIDP